MVIIDHSYVYVFYHDKGILCLIITIKEGRAAQMSFYIPVNTLLIMVKVGRECTRAEGLETP